MAEGIETPPKFNGLNFLSDYVPTIPRKSGCKGGDHKPFSIPDGDDYTWSDIATKEFDANSKTRYVLFQALNDDDIVRVIHCKFAYEIWSHLMVTHEGTSQVKMAKIDLFHS